jgi:hypothetical protein
LCRDLSRAAALSAAVALWGVTPAQAGDWELNPKLAAGYLYDNNYRLTPPDTENEVQGSVLDAEVDLRMTSPLTQFSLVPRIRSTYFPDDPEEESDDYFANLGWQHRTEVLRVDVRGEYSEETITSSEQPTADVDSGLGEVGDADAGIIAGIRNRRNLIRVRPSMTYEFSQRHQLYVGAHALDVDFDRVIPGAQTPYRQFDLNLGFGIETSPRSVVTLSAIGSRYDLEVETNSADAYGLQVDWSTNVTETTRSFLRAGAQYTQFNDNPLTGAEGEKVTTWLAGAGMTRTLRLTELFLDATHSVGPNSSGFVIQRNQLRFRATHLFTPRFSLFGGVRGTYDEGVRSSTLFPFRPRTYATGDVGFEWRIWQQLSLIMSVDYTWQDFDDDPLSASSSAGGNLRFVYEPRRRE